MVMPTDTVARKHCKGKIETAIPVMNCLKGIMHVGRGRDANSTILEKRFRGGYWIWSGANSPNSFRSISFRYGIADDISSWPGEVGEDGSPIELFRGRFASYGNRAKIYYNSTPTVVNSNIAVEYSHSSQGRYHIPCPHCEQAQDLKWGGRDEKFGIKFDRNKVGDVIDTWYLCIHCGKKNKRTS